MRRKRTYATHALHVHRVEQHGGFAKGVGHAVTHLLLLGHVGGDRGSSG
jgi:hypothetical protein